jgi:hypothetical protein
MDKPIKDIVARDLRRVTGSLLQRLESVMNSYAYTACNYIMADMIEKARYYVKLFYYARSLFLRELDKAIEELTTKTENIEALDRKIKEEVRKWHS